MEFAMYLAGLGTAWMLGFGPLASLSGRLSPDKGIAFAAAGLVGSIVVGLNWPAVAGGELGAVGDLFDDLLHLAVFVGGCWAGVASGRR